MTGAGDDLGMAVSLGEPVTSGGVAPVPAAAAGARGRRWRIVRVALGMALGLGLTALAVNALVGSSAELTGLAAAIDRLRPGWLLAAAAAEALSYLLYAAGQGRLLRAAGRSVGLGRLTGLSVAAQALGTSLPGGYAWNNVYSFRLLRRWGVREGSIVRVLVATTLLYVAALAVLAAISAQLGSDSGPVSEAAPVAYVVLGLVAAALVAWRRGVRPGRRAARTALAWLGRREGRTGRAMRTLRARGAALGHWDPLPAGAMALAAIPFLLSWVADAACLALAYTATGGAIPWAGFGVAYCAGQLAAMLPFTPGGLGVVEGSLTLALVAYGGGQIHTLAAVLLYRILSFWAIFPAGAICHLLLRRGEPRAVPAPAAG